MAIGAWPTLNTEYVHFPSREARSRYVARRFRKYLEGPVLDVGCFEAPLRNLLDGVEYTGIDLSGDPDIKLDLERCSELPFPANTFVCVLCIEVLEHLDNLHAVFGEIVRVSKRYVIVSLPNCWRDARSPIARGKGSFAHYGLPLEPPPERHKWFFGFSEARRFLDHQASRHNLTIVEMFSTEKPRAWLLRTIRKMLYPGERYSNRYTQTVWTVYEKRL